MPPAAFAAHLTSVVPGIEMPRRRGAGITETPAEAPIAHEPSMEFIATLSMTPHRPAAETFTPRPLRTQSKPATPATATPAPLVTKR
jgi:hypothetical protein